MASRSSTDHTPPGERGLGGKEAGGGGGGGAVFSIKSGRKLPDNACRDAENEGIGQGGPDLVQHPAAC